MNYQFLKSLMLYTFCLLLTTQLYGQRKKNKKPEKFFQVQFGYLVATGFDKTYTGFNAINIGLSKQKNKRIQSLELELIRFDIENIILPPFIPDPSLPPPPPRGSKRERRSLEVIYNYSFILSQKKDGFYLGPSGSFVINSNEIIPFTLIVFPTQQICFCIGAGFNSGYNWRLGKKVILGVSTRITLMDFGLLSEEIRNPVFLPIQRRNTRFSVDFLRPQYQLELGMKFKI